MDVRAAAYFRLRALLCSAELVSPFPIKTRAQPTPGPANTVGMLGRCRLRYTESPLRRWSGERNGASKSGGTGHGWEPRDRARDCGEACAGRGAGGYRVSLE